MALSIIHAKVNSVPDDPSEVLPGGLLASDWNTLHSISGLLDVIQGGTGVSSFTANGVLYGNGVSSLNVTSVNGSATNKFLTQINGGAPVWLTIQNSDIPAPTVGALGGLIALSGATSSKWVTFIDTSGVQHLAQPSVSDISGGSALTAVSDTNVTATLGGTPSTALLAAASVTIGWSGTLAPSRGGTGVNNGSNNLTLAAALTTTGVGAPTLAFPGTARTFTFPNASATLLSTGSTVGNASVNGISPTASTTLVMAGLGSSFTFTPQFSTRIAVIIFGTMSNNTANDGARATIAYGTGTAPVNGAAATGTAPNFTSQITSVNANQVSPFTQVLTITGLTLGTAYWFDLQFAAITGGSASIVNATYNAWEI